MKSNAYLIKYAKSKVGCPYWFGTYGQKATAALYKAKKKQYPKYYTATDYPKQYGKRVYDCAGLIKAALWTSDVNATPKYNSKQDFGATGFYNRAKKKGAIKTFDKVEGQLVFKGTAGTKTHVGIYSGGYVYHAKGHKYGVVKTKFKATDWTYWAQCHLFAEIKKPQPTPTPTPTPEPQPTPEPIKGDTVNIELHLLKFGSKGNEVKTAQRLLTALGYKDNNGEVLRIDGEIGSKTEFAIKQFQNDRKLLIDGEIGVNTWNALLK